MALYIFSQRETSRGGVVTVLSPRLNSSIISHGSDPMHIMIWIFISINNHYSRVVNVYASNDTVERSQL